MNYKACGHYLIIELDDVPKEEKTEGGIILAKTSDTNKREQCGMTLATVVDVGPNCWAGHYKTASNENSDPWCSVGDKVMISKHAGQEFPCPEHIIGDEKDYIERIRLIPDGDVLCLVGGE